MPISHLRITNFRNMSAVDISPEPHGLNIITGDNGSGKTSLLEAIYYLPHGRSFRVSNSNKLIKHEMEQFSISSQLITAERSIQIGVERSKRGDTQQRIAEQNANIAELAGFLPIRIINSQSHHLFESGPAYRRKYLDWGLFYQYENFFHCWRNYERVLKQRNIVLRDKRPRNELNSWTEELIKHGLEFDLLRRNYVAALTPILTQIAGDLLEISELEVCYLPGWDESIELADVLNENVGLEYAYGYTQYGPHRADLDLRINGLSIKHFLSRGQQKLFICAMIIAQGTLLFQHINKGLIYLLDDLPAELDKQSKAKLVTLLEKQGMQVFLTAIEGKMINEINDSVARLRKVFHVEHGAIRQVQG